MNRSYEEQLRQEGFLLKLTRGTSMEPMLRQWQEQSVIRTLDREPRKYDVVLFKRDNGQYVLHRIVGRKGKAFRIRGDNCMAWELVDREQIIGILTGFYRGEQFVDCRTDRQYLRYVHRRCAAFPLRWARFRGNCLLRALFRKGK